jgi:hypothetical protein
MPFLFSRWHHARSHTTLSNRHHCRMCGSVVCQQCTSRRHPKYEVSTSTLLCVHWWLACLAHLHTHAWSRGALYFLYYFFSHYFGRCASFVCSAGQSSLFRVLLDDHGALILRAKLSPAPLRSPYSLWRQLRFSGAFTQLVAVSHRVLADTRPCTDSDSTVIADRRQQAAASRLVPRSYESAVVGTPPEEWWNPPGGLSRARVGQRRWLHRVVDQGQGTAPPPRPPRPPLRLAAPITGSA